MPHNADLILTLAGALTAALVLGVITQKLKLSPIVGYLLAGILVGPFTPGFVANHEIASQCAEIGVILLMFGVGLHFHLKDLLAVRNVAIPGAVVQIVIATGLGVAAARMFGWSWGAGVIFGIAISVASTVVLTRVLADNRMLHTPTGHLAIGWLVVEDLFTVIVLVLLPALVGDVAGHGGSGGSIWATLGITLLKLTALVVFTFAIGGKVIPKFLGYVARTGSRELFTLTVLVVALGIAVGSAKFFGASMALGAFLAGMVVGQSDFSARAATDALPMRDAFAVLFFVSVGMLLDPSSIVTGWPLMLVTLGIILIGKPLAALLIALLLKLPLRSALAISVALAQIGEFSFILATLGTTLKVFPPEAMNTLVVASIVSISLNPLLFQMVAPITAWLEKRQLIRPAPAGAVANATHQTTAANHVVVIGYGQIGKMVSRILRDNRIPVAVIDLDSDIVEQLKREGIEATFGDASHREILLHAGIEKAGGLIISAATPGAAAAAQAARELNPKLSILARADDLAESGALRKAGADAAFSSEGEIALSMAGFIMKRLGATGDQIDRERDRVRKELF